MRNVGRWSRRRRRMCSRGRSVLVVAAAHAAELAVVAALHQDHCQSMVTTEIFRFKESSFWAIRE